MHWRSAAVLGLVTVALAAAASPARAGGFTLKLSAPPKIVVGQPTVIQVTGTIPVGSTQFPYWLSVVSISPTVMPSCPGESLGRQADRKRGRRLDPRADQP